MSISPETAVPPETDEMLRLLTGYSLRRKVGPEELMTDLIAELSTELDRRLEVDAEYPPAGA